MGGLNHTNVGLPNRLAKLPNAVRGPGIVQDIRAVEVLSFSQGYKVTKGLSAWAAWALSKSPNVNAPGHENADEEALPNFIGLPREEAACLNIRMPFQDISAMHAGQRDIHPIDLAALKYCS
jgi:hypothetical protein